MDREQNAFSPDPQWELGFLVSRKNCSPTMVTQIIFNKMKALV
jgi:hypothetical protein